MRVPHRAAQPRKCIGWLARCWVLSCMLVACTVGAASGQDATGVMPQTQDAAMAVPMGLVKRVGDRSVILHWDPVVASGLAGYRVYRASSPTEPFEPRSATQP